MPDSRVVSVVVPAYNHQAFVKEALESVRGQSLVPGEVVVVDDGSTDGTASVVEAATYPGLTLLRQENLGAHAALNRAIETARGPWIAILNSDDVFLPSWVETALGLARATGAALVVGRVRLVDHAGAPLPHDHPTARWYKEALKLAGSGLPLGEALERHNAAVTTSNFLLHKELWRALGGFRPYRYVHDLDFLLRAVRAHPSRVVFEPSLEGVLYRVHGGNTIAEDVDRALQERREMLTRHGGLGSRIATWIARPVRARGLRQALMEGGSPRPAPEIAPRRVDGEPSVRCGLVVNELDAGGMEEMVALLAVELPRHGVEPRILCTRSGGRVARRLDRAGVPVTVAPTPEARRRWLEGVRPHVLSTHFTPLEILAELGEHGVPMVETVHNVYAWFSPEDWRREGEKQRWLHGIAAVSHGASAYYRRQVGTGCAPVTVIPNGVVPDRVLTLPVAVARRVLGLPEGDAVLLQLGRVEPSKNQGALLAAFRKIAVRHPGSVLVLAGAVGDPGYAAGLRADHADLLAAGRVRIVDPREDVGTLLSAADAYVSDSWFEGWSLAASEALWTGLPLVVSDTGGSREMVGADGERGFVIPNMIGDGMGATPVALPTPSDTPPPDHVAAVAQALDLLLRARDAWRARRPEIRSWARGNLDASRVAADYARLLGDARLTRRGESG